MDVRAQHFGKLQQIEALVGLALTRLLSNRDLSEPDGRSLYAYRLSETEFRLLTEAVEKAHLVDLWRTRCNKRCAGAFTLFAAEWFRREFSGGVRKWASLAPSVLPDLSHQERSTLTRRGLTYWGRPLRERADGKYYLLSLALEGGMPLRMLTDDDLNWVRRYFESVLNGALAAGVLADDRPRIRAIAESQQDGLRDTWRDDTTFELATDLVSHVMELRAYARRSSQASISCSAALDVSRPGWRSELPLPTDGEGSVAAQKLVDGLINSPGRKAMDGLICERLLTRSGDGRWIEGARVQLEGAIASSFSTALKANDGRFRLVASGVLADCGVGEVGTLEPPQQVGETWRVKAWRSPRLTVKGAPFDREIAFALTRSGTQHASFICSGGEPVRADVLFFEAREGDEANPSELVQCARFGKRSPQTVFALTPETAEVVIEGGQALSPFGTLDQKGMRLWRIAAPARILLGDDQQMLVLPGAETAWREIDVMSAPLIGWTVADGRVDVVRAPVRARIREEDMCRPGQAGEIIWRYSGQRLWRHSDTVDAALGMIELRLIDLQTTSVIQSRRLCVLPERAKVDVERDATDELKVTVSGWGASHVSLAGGDTLLPDMPITLDSASNQNDHLSINVVFAAEWSSRATIERPVPAARRARFVSGDGVEVRKSYQIPISDMRGFHATGSGRHRIVAALGRGTRAQYVERPFESEFRLGVFNTEIQRLFAHSDDLHAEVVVQIFGESGAELVVKRSGPRMSLRQQSGKLMLASDPPTADSRLVARSLLSPRLEYAVETSRSDQSDAVEIHLPPALEGPCLLYYRNAISVETLPAVVEGWPLSAPKPGRLPAALCEASQSERAAAIDAVLEALPQHSESALSDLRLIIELANSLSGVPATAFDVLRRLPKHAGACASVMIFALGEERAEIARLSRETPLDWRLIPFHCWQDGLETYAAHCKSSLVASGLTPEIAQSHADAARASAIEGIAETSVELRPAMELLAWLSNSASAPHAPNEAVVVEAAQAWVRENASDTALVSPLTDELRSASPLGLKIARRFEPKYGDILLAPWLAAAATAGKIPMPENGTRAFIVQVSHDFPEYFDAVYATALNFCMRGQA